MGYLALSDSELMMLSSLAIPGLSAHSPMRGLMLRTGADGDEKELQEIMAHFYDEGLVWFDRQRKPHLNRELEAVFWTLNRPQELLGFKRLGRRETEETYFARNGNLWVQYVVGMEERFNLVGYPFQAPMLEQWFAEDLMTGFEFAQPLSGNMTLELDYDQLTLLILAGNLYHMRAGQTGQLGPDQMWFAPEELRQGATGGGGMPMLTDPRKCDALFSDPPRVMRGIEALSQKKCLVMQNGRYAYSNLTVHLFDPHAIQDMVVVNRYEGIIRSKTLQVLKSGYLLISEGTMPTVVQIGYRTGNSDLRGLYRELMQFPPLPAAGGAPR